MSVIGLLGTGFGAGLSCDYPAITNVRQGIVYASGLLTGVLNLPIPNNVRFGVPYGANGTEYNGTVELPAENKVRIGIGYGANGTEFTGTFRCGPPMPPTGTATQGVTPQELLDAFRVYLLLLTGLPDNRVVLWCQPGRPNISGFDWLAWYAPEGMEYDKSEGPVRFGNKFNPTFRVTIVSRNMVDSSQTDIRRLPPHYARCWKIINSFQNLGLFSAYTPPPAPPAEWYPPQPDDGAYTLTVEPMYLAPTDPNFRDEFEEGTIATSFRVVLPSVLKLSI